MCKGCHEKSFEQSLRCPFCRALKNDQEIYDDTIAVLKETVAKLDQNVKRLASMERQGPLINQMELFKEWKKVNMAMEDLGIGKESHADEGSSDDEWNRTMTMLWVAIRRYVQVLWDTAP